MKMITRRQFLRGTAGLVGASLATALYATRIEPYWVEYISLAMPIRHLPASLAGRTLVQLSDLHIGNRFDWQYILNTFEKIKRLAPDYVVYTGDFVSYETAEQLGQLREVMQHAPHGTLGTAATLGNHDYGEAWSQAEVADDITTILEDAQVSVLRNALHNFDGGLHILGIDDVWGTNSALKKATALLEPEQPTVVLCHNPDVADRPVWRGYDGWILSGHTHGGQVKPPFLPPPLLPVHNKTYTAGKFELQDGRSLYINRALGNLWPIRFNVRPEVTIFTLEIA